MQLEGHSQPGLTQTSSRAWESRKGQQSCPAGSLREGSLSSIWDPEYSHLHSLAWISSWCVLLPERTSLIICFLSWYLYSTLEYKLQRAGFHHCLVRHVWSVLSVSGHGTLQYVFVVEWQLALARLPEVTLLGQRRQREQKQREGEARKGLCHWASVSHCVSAEGRSWSHTEVLAETNMPG